MERVLSGEQRDSQNLSAASSGRMRGVSEPDAGLPDPLGTDGRRVLSGGGWAVYPGRNPGHPASDPGWRSGTVPGRSGGRDSLGKVMNKVIVFTV